MTASLGDEINASTRPLHTTLNRLILSLLPLSLPPHTHTPHIYAHGMSHIHPIYATFETSLRHPTSSSAASPRMSRLISSLYIPALQRTQGLEADLSLLGVPPAPRIMPEHTPGSPLLRSFLSHISTSTTQKPHLLVAYTWLLYLAVFSGGRYLRAQLRVANINSWRIGVSPDADPNEPLQFWCFPGNQDGEDLKVEFKAQVQNLEKELSLEERKEIVAEAKEIMNRMIDVIQEISTNIDPGIQREPDNESTIGQLLTLRLFLPLSMLKVLGSWSWNFASGLGTGLGAVSRGAVA